MYRIAQPINGISINGNEYLLDENGEVLEFKNRKEAEVVFKEKIKMSEEDAWNNYSIAIWDMEDK